MGTNTVPSSGSGYTDNAFLRKPATAERNWDVSLNANADAIDGMTAIGSLLVTPTELPSASLNVRITGGAYTKADGTVGVFSGVTSYGIPPSSSVSLWLTDSGVLTSGSDFPTTAHLRLAQVVTSPSTVQSLIDKRIGPHVCGTGLGFLLKSGDAVAGPFSVVSSGSSLAAFTVTPDVPSIGFFGVAPAPQAPMLVALADNSTGTVSNTITDVGAQFSQTLIDGNFASLTAKVNALIGVLQRHGLMST